jgi:hypothetical protein
MSRIAMLFAIALLVGCATPLPVAEFDAPGTSGGRTIASYAARDFPYGELKTFAQVQGAMRAYRHLYLEEADKKRLQAQNASEVSFFSSIVGVLGGVAKSQDAALAGGGVAAGAGLYADRYRLTVQAKNYETAAEALECMFQILPEGAAEALAAFQIKGTAAGLDSVFRTAALESLFFVRSKLRSLQTTFEFGTADVNKLKDALSKKADEVEESNDKDAVAKSKSAKFDAEALKNYRKDLKACEAKFGT